jgi:hypothetical protein
MARGWRNTWQFAAVLPLACAVLVPASARAITPGFPPEVQCDLERGAFESVTHYTKLLSPAEGASVEVGAAVTFSVEGGPSGTVQFAVSTSPSPASSLDIDVGPGVRSQPNVTSFTSTKAAAVPGTIYWAATFTSVLNDCPNPVAVFTTPARALTVVAPPPPAPPSQPGPPPVQTRRVRCIVPELEGDSLARARRALQRAHCSLGAIRGSRHGHRLAVRSQGIGAGRKLASGAPVAVTLAPVKTRKHR